MAASKSLTFFFLLFPPFLCEPFFFYFFCLSVSFPTLKADAAQLIKGSLMLKKELEAKESRDSGPDDMFDKVMKVIFFFFFFQACLFGSGW